MASLFGGNVFSTPVGQLIEKATDASLASENWALNMEICDIINESEEGPKDAMKAIRKRLTQNVGKNYTVVMYALTVLETCVKNCGKRFHNHVAQKDFLQELIKIIGPKNDPPQVVQEKVLSLIQTWADAFRGSPDLSQVEKVYQDLKSKGIEFPMTDLDSLAPIHTPARTAPEVDPTVNQSPHHSRPPPQPMQQSPHDVVPQVMMAQGPVNLNPEQLAKLRSELDIVQGNSRVFSEMLTELQPNTASPAELELLQELNGTCRQMQQRVVELVERVANEEVTGELLRINDELNNVFLRYDRFERYRTGQAGQVTSTSQPATEAPPPMPQPTPSLAPPPPVHRSQPANQEPQVANLIDFGESPPAYSAEPPPQHTVASTNDIHVQLANMSMGGGSVSTQLGQLSSTTATNAPPPTKDEFDMFAQSRQAFDANKQAVGSNVYANQSADQYRGGLGAAVNAKNTGNPYTKNPNPADDNAANEIKDQEAEYEEMEKWLQRNPKTTATGQKEEPMTSAEFDRFLAERAASTDGTTGVPNNTSTATAGRNTSSRGGRQMQKDDTENALFAL